jgi:flagellar biogenesis protein FliO
MNVADQLGHRISGAKESSLSFQAIVFWRWVCGWGQKIMRVSQRRPKQLKLCESLPLGERRFVAVVEFEKSRFLIGGTQGSLVLLAPLQNSAIPDETDQNAQPMTKITPSWGLKP